MRNRICPSLLLCLALFGVAGRAAQPSSRATLVKAAHLLDPRSGIVRSPAAVLIENGKIMEVGAPSQLQRDTLSDADILDLGNVTLLPGLIDSHTHLLLDIVVPPEAEMTGRSNATFAPGCCWRSPSRPQSACSSGPNWRARIWRAALRRCATWDTLVSMAMPRYAMRSVPDGCPAQ